MKDTLLPAATPAAARAEPPSWRKKALGGVGLLVLATFAAAVGAGAFLLGRFYGNGSFIAGITNLPRAIIAVRDPRVYFPGQSRITVLCLGLDRNIMVSRDRRLNGMPYTKGARSDVMMVASLDLYNDTVNILSIPRDTRVRLPGRESFSKINDAHARGGIPYTREAVEAFLGTGIDYHVVIKQEAIEAVVNALNGLDVNVEKDMDYEDHWGQLFIHLKEGPQRLDGKQVVGYMRFRHDGEADLGRIRRQQQVIQLLSERVKDPGVLFKAAGLIDAIRKFVQTDLTPDQQIALAHLFHKINPANVRTVALPVAETAKVDGISYVIPDEFKKEAAVDFVVNGNPEAFNRLIRVELRNASGDRELYNRAYDCLRHYGFEVVRGSRVAGEPAGATRAVQHTNLRGAARRVLEALGLGGNVEKDEGKRTDVTLYVGKDLEGNAVLAASDNWPPIPERPARTAWRPERRRREEPGAEVRIRSLDEAPEPSTEPGESETPPDPAINPADGDQPGREPPAPGPTPGTPPGAGAAGLG